MVGTRRMPRMSRSMVERRLQEVSERLKQLRDELVLTDEQVSHFNDAADDARIRALGVRDAAGRSGAPRGTAPR